MAEPNIDELLQRGIAAAKAAQQKQPAYAAYPASEPAPQELKQQARRLLLQVTELDESNAQAWLWLSAVMDGLLEKYTCLETVLTLDPANRAARAGLRLLQQQVSSPAYVRQEQREPIPEGLLQGSWDDLGPPSTAQPWVDTPYQDDESWYWQEEDAAPAAPLPPPPPPVRCPFCDQLIASSETVCPHCQLPLVIECPKCTTLMDVEWPTCKQCGYELGNYQLGSVYFSELALGYQKYNRLPRALAALQLAEQISPDQPDLYRQMGEVQAELGQTHTAITTLQQAIAREPEQIGPYLSLGKVYQRDGHWDKAEGVYKQALKVLPRSSESHLALGDLFMLRGQLAKARRHLQRAVSLNRRSGMAWARLGQFYDLTGNRSAAAPAYRQALKWLPDDQPEAQHAHDRLQILDPKLLSGTKRGWPELIRRLLVALSIPVLAALFNTGWWPPSLQGADWLALALAVAGAFLWLSGASLPQNPLIRLLAGEQGLEDSILRPLITIVGGVLWLAALTIILLPVLPSALAPNL
jgi:tetratricopeptide (TPR) repeat protein